MSRAKTVRVMNAVPRSIDAEAPRIPTTQEIAIRAYEIYLSAATVPARIWTTGFKPSEN